jgi:hypothetical protein
VLGLGLATAAFAGTKYSVEVQNVQTQTDGVTVAAGCGLLGYNQYSLVAKIDTGGNSLAAAPILTLPTATPTYPSGAVAFPTGALAAPNWPSAGGYNRYQFGNAWASAAALAANVGSGTFTFTFGDASITSTLDLNTASPTLPPTPLLTSGGAWSDATLLVDPSTTTTLDFNSSDFTAYATGLGGAISVNLFTVANYPTPCIAQVLSQYGLGNTDPALTSLIVPAGTLTAGQDYLLQINYSQLEETNSTYFTGTGISGNPLGMSYDTSSTFVEISAVPEPGTVGSLVAAGTTWLAMTGRRRRNRA